MASSITVRKRNSLCKFSLPQNHVLVARNRQFPSPVVLTAIHLSDCAEGTMLGHPNAHPCPRSKHRFDGPEVLT